jgi:hypothetical protein
MQMATVSTYANTGLVTTVEESNSVFVDSMAVSTAYVSSRVRLWDDSQVSSLSHHKSGIDGRIVGTITLGSYPQTIDIVADASAAKAVRALRNQLSALLEMIE